MISMVWKYLPARRQISMDCLEYPQETHNPDAGKPEMQGNIVQKPLELGP